MAQDSGAGLRFEQLCLIIGAMKCGSTTLFDYMKQFSAVHPCALKESNFFTGPYDWARGWGWYDGLFEGFDPTRHLWALEGTTDYSKAPYFDHVVPRLQAAGNLRVKVVYIMRDPVKRIVSHIRHRALTGAELYDFPAPARGLHDPGRVDAVTLDISRYAFQLDPYRVAFGGEAILPVVFEDMVADPGAVLDRVAAFLGIESDVPAGQDLHSNDFSNKLHNRGLGALRHNPAIRGVVRAVVPGPLRARISQRILGNNVEQAKITLTEAEVAHIHAELADDMRRLRDLYDIDVAGKWGFPV